MVGDVMRVNECFVIYRYANLRWEVMTPAGKWSPIQSEAETFETREAAQLKFMAWQMEA